VQPNFDYCNVFWGNCNRTLSNKIQKIKNSKIGLRAFLLTQAMTLMPISLSKNFISFGWRKLGAQRDIHEAVMVFKSLNGLSPDFAPNL